MRILFISHQELAAPLHPFLETFGYTSPLIAESFIHAHQLLPHTPVDLVILDTSLLSEPTAFSEARHLFSAFDLPVVCLAHQPDQDLAHLSTEPWCFGFLSAPHTTPHLLHATLQTAHHRWQRQSSHHHPAWLHQQDQRRTQELEILYRAAHAFSASLDLDTIITSLLAEVRHLLGSVAASTWLLDPQSGHLVCQQVTGPRSATVRNWRLTQGEGIASHVARSGRSIIVPDTHLDQRHFKGVDRATGLPIRSILAVPLLLHHHTLGVLEVVDTRPHRFHPADLKLVEALAAAAAVAIDNARLHASIQQVAIQQERRSLANDLHASLLQSLYAISLAAESSLIGLQQIGVNGNVANPIKHIQDLSNATLSELKSRLNTLCPSVVPESHLLDALTQHCDTLRDQYALTILFLAGPEPTLSPQQRDGIYFIAKESLWNVIQHAQASRVNIHLLDQADHLFFQVDDNGIGFDPITFHPDKLRGFHHMQDRAQTLGGKLDISSRPGHGTRITLRIPTQQTQPNGSRNSSRTPHHTTHTI
jgi:signal transduction histidine kinase